MTFPSPVRPVNPRADVQPALDRLEQAFPGVIETAGEDGDIAVIIPAARLLGICELLRGDPLLRFDLLVAETATDWIDWFDVVYVVRSTALCHDLAFTVQVDHDAPEVDSVAPVWSAANWMEREIYDLMGIQFVGHPDLRRVLTWDEFEGHPLRKGFGLEGDSRAYDQVPPDYKKTGEE